MKQTLLHSRLSTSYLSCLIISSLIFILFGCAQPDLSQVDINSLQHQQKLMQLQKWQIKGRLGFTSQQKKQSASFSWQQDNQTYKLNLTSIIGTSLLKMTGNSQQVTLEADDQIYQDTDASFLIWRITGWQIPVNQFPTWVKGQITENAEAVTADQGWITQIKPNCESCEDWLINYDNYKLVNNIWLPHSISFINRSNNNRLLIRVNSWL
ncbi:lipoprotein insertase outer membrane protein LolB [Paraglaciecola aquimarina]|uniref:Outer-membrane lipoprotein LolB n=1 Tax=Paraglaciecola aquimarina TaxID=1235557 RepID=A0ABU3SZY6_9ALTE|nr:lipoprotein insertase outer membrane protein LolB [Paraglaciecola aquimarina]MDU0355553.1 lipoprotein insertase outer membrane protein LolB [Paraglaciecola aquimarina]